jgi:UDP-N-acetylmuramoyl-L-alanyl-D-glutamate--2,6-diaminopimelate ligase
VPEVIAARPLEPARTSLRAIVEWLGAEVVEGRTTGREGEAHSGGHVGDAPPVQVTGVSLNSERTRPGDLYAAVAGARAHGARFAGRAVEAGAVAVLTDPPGAAMCAGLGVPVLTVEAPRAVLGALAARVYGEPAESLRLLGVTGTQGKTTTTWLAEGGLAAAGITAAVVGTVGTRIGGVEVVSSLTTPEAPDLHALFAVMRERGTSACAMEVSSHALVMGRVDGVVFDVAAFTNLGRDHLDFHADLEDYYRAKASLFTPGRARLGVVNVDDEHGRRLVGDSSIPVRTFSTVGAVADWTATDVHPTAQGSRFTVRGPDGAEIAAGVSLAGAYNVSNALCAVAALAEAGYDPAAIAAGVAGAAVPGRLERVDAGQDYLALVDYAHKPDAVSAALTAVRPRTPGRLIVVIGAGGDRDRGKRPIMGEIAARLADVVVVTDDNPRSESPARIRAEVLEGAARVPAAHRAEVLESGDRREAIRLAVSTARAGDTVLVAGKGHETGQEVEGAVHPFDDRVVLREELGAP